VSRTRWKVVAALLGAAALCCIAVPALASTNRAGEVLASFDGGISPSALPRAEAAPVAVHVEGALRSVSGDPEQLPQLRRIEVAINRQGRLFDRGLPVCQPSQIQPASEAAARRICGAALVGHGKVDVQVRINSQLPFEIHADLLAFNGPRRHGRRLIFAHVYAGEPPGSFTLACTVSRRPGQFGTVLETTLPPRARGWAYLTHFEMTLHRTYVYRGRRRSYVSAACSAPAGFRSALFPFARATYSFLESPGVTLSVAGECHVAGGE